MGNVQTVCWRELNPSDVTQAYVDWFSNSLVTRYSDNQYRTFSLDNQKEYVAQCQRDQNLLLLGIFVKQKHVGCLLISGMTSPHQRCEISYVIGALSCWGNGLATQSVSYAVELLKEMKTIHKVTAGASANNIASQRVLLKCGFKLEAVKLRHLFYHETWDDMLEYCLFLNTP